MNALCSGSYKALTKVNLSPFNSPCPSPLASGASFGFAKTLAPLFKLDDRSLKSGSLRIRCSSEHRDDTVTSSQNGLKFVSSSTGFFLFQSAIACYPALASGYTDAEYVEGILALVAFAGFYFLAVPPVILWYLKERTFKSKMWEKIFQFSIVFLFFPGLMVWAPFVNFRPFPSDPSKMPKI